MKRNISGGVEELSLQSVDSFFRRSHRTTYRGGWLKPKAPRRRSESDQGNKFPRSLTPSSFVIVPLNRDESHTANWSAWERAMCSVVPLPALGVAPIPSLQSDVSRPGPSRKCLRPRVSSPSTTATRRGVFDDARTDRLLAYKPIVSPKAKRVRTV